MSQTTAPPVIQDLRGYRPGADWHPGAPLVVQIGWRLLGRPLLASQLPGTPWRKALLRLFGARLGRGGRLKPQLQITFPWRLVVGDDCWLGEQLWIDNLAPVHLGDRVCLSQGAFLCTGNHDYRSPSFALRIAPIQIEADAWIAARAVLAPGTAVGAGAVVGLAAVVSGAVPAGAILQGNPAAIKGWRYSH